MTFQEKCKIFCICIRHTLDKLLNVIIKKIIMCSKLFQKLSRFLRSFNARLFFHTRILSSDKNQTLYFFIENFREYFSCILRYFFLNLPCRISSEFKAIFAEAPDYIVRVPGRVNLIGNIYSQERSSSI